MTRQHGIEFVAIDIQRQELSQCNQQTTEQIWRQADKLFTYQSGATPLFADISATTRAKASGC